MEGVIIDIFGLAEADRDVMMGVVMGSFGGLLAVVGCAPVSQAVLCAAVCDFSEIGRERRGLSPEAASLHFQFVALPDTQRVVLAFGNHHQLALLHSTRLWRCLGLDASVLLYFWQFVGAHAGASVLDGGLGGALEGSCGEAGVCAPGSAPGSLHGLAHYIAIYQKTYKWRAQ